MIIPRVHLIAGVALLFLGACKPSLQTEVNVYQNCQILATSDQDFKMTVADFYRKIAESDALTMGGILERDAANYYLDSFLVDTLIGLRAQKINLRDYYEYYFRFRENAIRALVEAYSVHAILDGIKVDSLEILDYFESHKDDFYVEEQILPYHIVISPYGLKKGVDSLIYKVKSNEEIEEAARQIAFDVRSKIDSKKSFEELARKFSHDSFSARKGGRIEWSIRGFYAWPFDSLAFAAKPGDIVGPYRDKDGWQILYIEDYKQAGVPPLNPEIYNTCRWRVMNEKARQASFAIFDTLLADIKLKYNEELYDTNIYFVEKATWAAVVNETDTIDFGELSAGEERIRETYKVPNSTADMKKELVRYMARRWVIAQEARNMGLDTLPDVVKEIDKHRQYYSRLVVELSQCDPNWEPSTEELQKYYNENQTKYIVAKPLRVQQVLVKDSTLADFECDQANAGVDFLKLAEEYYIGDESVRRDLADLGFI
ncbi:MAG: peptidylprolyl isomerase, partial [Candidatus Zixiibacteriota bacterium]